MNLQKASLQHLDKMCKIYNDSVQYTTATFDIQSIDNNAFYKRYMDIENSYLCLVALQDKEVIGWASITKWSQREGYKYSAETSTYIDKNYQKMNIGSLLKEEIINWAIKNNFHMLISFCTEGNIGAQKINEKFNFKKIGVMQEIGFKFNSFHNLEIWQKILKNEV